MATITSHYARAALAGCTRKGHDVELLLSRAGIPQELLNQKQGRVHEVQMTRLIQSIWNLMEDEFMGFTSKPCKQGSFAMMCDLVSRCDTTDAMFLKGVRFYGLITDDIQMQYRQADNHREFVVSMNKPELDFEHFYLEFWLVIWHRFISWMIGTKIKLQSVHFTYPEPDHSREFEHQFACPCHFGESETKLCFSKQYADMPSVRTQRELAIFLKNSPADLMTVPGSDNSISLQVKSFLIAEMETSNQFPKFEYLAAELNMSPQTLRRKLHEEGSSFQKIKDSTRCDIAIEKLRIQQMSVNDVADLLGFSEPRSFTRAFKQWTGMTPSQYRLKA